MDALGRSIQYDIIDWGETAAREPALIGNLFARLAADLAGGRLAPLPRHVFPLEDVAEAFQLMARAGHVGRIVVRHIPHAVNVARRDGTYLITGGLSGLGLKVARYLAERGAGKLVLLSRRGSSEEAEQELNEIRQTGTVVVVEAANVTEEPALAAVLARLRSEGPPLRGVLHAAGVLANGALLQQNAENFRRVLAPKVEGTALLDRLTRSDPLDWFVLFSSIAGVLGAAGQANHAAANAYLDELAHHRRGLGLPGLSIDWGAWSEVGAAAGLADQLAGLGVGFLSPSQGLAAFEWLLQKETAQAAVLPIDWERYRRQIGPGVHAALLSDIGGKTAALAVTQSSTETAARNFRREVEEAPPPRRRRMISDFVRDRLLKALGMDAGRPVDPQVPFGDLGLNSLLSVELRNVLGTALGRPFPATLLFDYPTIDTLTDFIMQDCWGGAEPSEAAAPQNLVANVQDLSDDEVDRRLRAKYGLKI